MERQAFILRGKNPRRYCYAVVRSAIALICVLFTASIESAFADPCGEFREALAFETSTEIMLERVLEGKSTPAEVRAAKETADYKAAMNVRGEAYRRVLDKAHAVFLSIDDEPSTEAIAAIYGAWEQAGHALREISEWRESTAPKAVGRNVRIHAALYGVSESIDTLHDGYIHSIFAVCEDD